MRTDLVGAIFIGVEKLLEASIGDHLVNITRESPMPKPVRLVDESMYVKPPPSNYTRKRRNALVL